MKKLIATLLVILITFLMLVCLSSSSKEEKKQDVQVSYFFRPSCPHCQRFSSEWEKFKKSTDTKYVEYDCEKQPCMAISGVPSIKITKNGNTVMYEGKRTSDELKNFIQTL